MSGLYVQYGCGFSAPKGWWNFDSSPVLRFERIPVLGRVYTKNASRFPENVRYGDIVKGLPVQPGSCRGIYCSHILEHLAFDDARRALDHTHRYLEAGGTFRLVVPDLRELARSYLAEESPTAAHEFMETASLGSRRRARGMLDLLRLWLGNSAHLWMWDEKSLTGTLEEHGFVRVRRCAFGDAADPKFREVEEAERFHNCLALECSR